MFFYLYGRVLVGEIPHNVRKRVLRNIGLSNGLIGLTGEGYLHLLEELTNPRITPNWRMMDVNLVTFEQDGIPPHFEQQVRAYLDLYFPRRFIDPLGLISA